MIEFTDKNWKRIDYPCGKIGFVLTAEHSDRVLRDKLADIKNHFMKAGSTNSKVLAGLIGVTTTTIEEWKNPKGLYFNSYFCAIIDYYEGVAANRIMREYTSYALGLVEEKTANIKLLERLALEYISPNDDSSAKIDEPFSDSSSEDILKQIKIIEQDISAHEES
jgi:hypothetical protein